MELRLRSHWLAGIAPDWTAAAAAGFVAGAFLMVLEMLWSTGVMHATPWTMSHKIAALVLGPQAVQSHDFDLGMVAIALATHYVLGIVFGILLAIVLTRFHLDVDAGKALLAGAMFGVLLYLFNFHGMTGFFPWFVEMRGLPALMAHVIFGIACAALYWKLQRHHLPQA